MAPPPKISKPRAPNPIRNQREIRAPTPVLRKAVNSAPRPAKRACPNLECSSPNINDEGTCTNCGTIVNDSNIVNEVSFGENSAGAAVIQGSWVGEGQTAARSMGPGFRAGGEAAISDSRAATQREGKQHMFGFGVQFKIPEATIDVGAQLFKVAADSNFIQGRRIDMVAAVCLYTACRLKPPCKVMLIDFADRIQVNVFKLGHTFKVLHRTITMGSGIMPMLPEDLMFRFATKLDFGTMTAKVADTAIRLSQRMQLDWMVVGRRPSGVCGACLILAARIHNFRRTVTEVVYIVKVTTATIQKRMEEFKLTASANLTVDEFLHTEFLESAHDPPSFYQKQEDFIKNKKTRKRKRRGELEMDDEEDDAGDDADPNKRQKTATPHPEGAAAAEGRIDADGFAIPATPAAHIVPAAQNEFEDLVDETAENPTEAGLTKLVSKFGDQNPALQDEMNDALSPTGSASGAQKIDHRRAVEINVSDEWMADEERIRAEILELISDPMNSELIFDPNTNAHAKLFSMAEKRSQKHIADFERANPRKDISDSQTILEDEFANDPEVQNCLLSPEDIEKKEKVWVNANKRWLREQQVKEYQKRVAANGPPKKTRNRKKMVRIGEYQNSPASSASEAAELVMKKRALSKKINYNNIQNLFKNMGGGLGSAATSRATSRAGSSIPESPAATNDEESEMGDDTSQAERPTSRSASRVPGVVDEDADADDDDYINPSDPPTQRQEYQAPEEPMNDSWKLGTGASNDEDYVDDDEDREPVDSLAAGGLGDVLSEKGDDDDYGQWDEDEDE